MRRASIEVRVTDDGHGFEVGRALARAAQRGRLGIVGIGERVRMLGGTFEIDSAPGGRRCSRSPSRASPATTAPPCASHPWGLAPEGPVPSDAVARRKPHWGQSPAGTEPHLPPAARARCRAHLRSDSRRTAERLRGGPPALPSNCAPPTPHCGASTVSVVGPPYGRISRPLSDMQRPGFSYADPARARSAASLRKRRPRRGGRLRRSEFLCRQRHTPAEEVLLVEPVPRLRRERRHESGVTGEEQVQLLGLRSGLPRLAPLRRVLRRRRGLDRMSRRDDEEAQEGDEWKRPGHVFLALQPGRCEGAPKLARSVVRTL